MFKKVVKFCQMKRQIHFNAAWFQVMSATLYFLINEQITKCYDYFLFSNLYLKQCFFSPKKMLNVVIKK